jgi:hypothetical protein
MSVLRALALIVPFSASSSKTVVGWTLGFGAEQMINTNWALRAEYRYSNYETFTAIYGTRATLGITSDIDMRTNTGLLGLTYEFGSPYTLLLAALFPVDYRQVTLARISAASCPQRCARVSSSV